MNIILDTLNINIQRVALKLHERSIEKQYEKLEKLKFKVELESKIYAMKLSEQQAWIRKQKTKKWYKK